MEDLTIIYLTLNKVPKNFAQYQRRILKEAIGSYPLISVSREPIDFGENILDTDNPGYINIYRQILKACKIAKTNYIAIAEDDVLYNKEHFSFFRPPLDTFGYNQSRWALFTWGEPTYSWRNRKSNCSMIAPRKLAIEALEERFAKYPGDTMPKPFVGELGRERVERNLGVTLRKSVEVHSGIPIIQINHDEGTEDRQARHRKKLGTLKAFDIPYWGKAVDIVSNYK